jgi:hypothetical protein
MTFLFYFSSAALIKVIELDHKLSFVLKQYGFILDMERPVAINLQLAGRDHSFCNDEASNEDCITTCIPYVTLNLEN